MPGKPPIKWESGSKLNADDLRRNSTYTARSVNTGATATQRQVGSQVLNDTNARAQHKTPASAMFRAAQIVSIHDDHLICNFYQPVADDVMSAADVVVAKPFHLWRTGFDGETITYPQGGITYTYDGTYPEYKRVHNDGSTSGTFDVTPTWFIGEKIVIFPLASGVLVNDVYAYWMELPGVRNWAEVV